MQICVHLDNARLFRWHQVLIAQLAAAGHEPVVSFVDTPEPLPVSFTIALDYDRARLGAGTERLSARLKPSAFAAVPKYAGGGYTVMLDLSPASSVVKHPGRVLRPLYDGSYRDYALFHSLLMQRAPQLALADSAWPGEAWAIGLPAIEAPWRPSAAFDMIASRLIEGIVKTFGSLASGDGAPSPRPKQRNFAGRSSLPLPAAAWICRRVGRKITRAMELATNNEAKWHVAWRPVPSGPGVLADGDAELQIKDFRVLEDGGGARYFADPFVFEHAGTTHIFVEEVPGKHEYGRISHFTIGQNGAPSKVERVLDTGSHLSYPQVFAHGGEIFMLPESSSAGGLDLYRAVDFPYRWEKTARLIGQPVSDATLVEHEGRFFILASRTYLQSSSWDGLYLYHSDKLDGPWMERSPFPLVMDATRARLGGSILTQNGGPLVRFAQNCRDGYGYSLNKQKIEHLSEGALQEVTSGTIRFAGAGMLGPHTYSRSASFEAVDLFASPRNLRAAFTH